MKQKSVDQYSSDGEFIQWWPSLSFAAHSLGMSHQNINRSLDIRTRTEGGFMWKTAIQQQERKQYLRLDYDYSETERKDFEQKIKEFSNIVSWLCRKYDFITTSNRDDYIQEATAFAWVQYHRFLKLPGEKNNAQFGGWYKMTCGWAMINYFQNNRKYRCDNFDESFDSYEDKIDDSLANVLALYHCIEDLCDRHRAVVYEWLNDKSSLDMANMLNITVQSYRQLKMHIVNILRTKMNYYLFGIRDSRLRVSFGVSGQCQPVEQYDLQGRFVAWYPSITSVVEKGFTKSSVKKVLRNACRTHKGFFWKYGKPRENPATLQTSQSARMAG